MICILVVEKSEVTRLAVVNLVSGCGYQAVGYASAREAFKAMSGVAFDLMITGVGAFDDSIASLLIEAKALQPHIRIVLGMSQADQLLPSRIADACLPQTFSEDEFEGVIFDALDAVPMRDRGLEV
jgi:DNA-binding NarL/FixJ family response regulator